MNLLDLQLDIKSWALITSLVGTLAIYLTYKYKNSQLKSKISKLEIEAEMLRQLATMKHLESLEKDVAKAKGEYDDEVVAYTLSNKPGNS